MDPAQLHERYANTLQTLLVCMGGETIIHLIISHVPFLVGHIWLVGLEHNVWIWEQWAIPTLEKKRSGKVFGVSETKDGEPTIKFKDLLGEEKQS